MADAQPSPRRLNPASIALGLAGLLALVAVGVAIFRSGGEEALSGNEAANAAVHAEAAGMEETIASLTERVRRDPDDHEGWFQLGFAYRNSGRFAEADQAFRRASELAPRTANYLAYRAEILLVQAENDTVPPEAERLLRQVIEIEPSNAQARFYLATIRDIRGDHQGAVNDLIALLRDAPAGAPWEAQVRQAATGIARENNINIEGRLPASRPAPQSAATAAIPGPTREQLDAARGIPPSQQDEMARTMVSNLAERLRRNPRDANGWIMLMRSRMVLEDRNGAGEALRSGLAAFEGDAAAQAQLRDAARQLGVPGAS